MGHHIKKVAGTIAQIAKRTVRHFLENLMQLIKLMGTLSVDVQLLADFTEGQAHFIPKLCHECRPFPAGSDTALSQQGNNILALFSHTLITDYAKAISGKQSDAPDRL